MDATQFRFQVLNLFFQDIHRLEQNNYSFRRYSYDGVDRSQLFDVPKHATFLAWFNDRYEDVFRAWSRLHDQASRDMYLDVIRYRLAGHLHVRIRSRVHSLQAEADRFGQAMTTSPSEVRLSGLFGEIVRHRGSWADSSYDIDTVPGGLRYALVYGQYYYDRDGVRIAPEVGDFVIDAGAFTGDSSVIFGKSVGANGQVYAFDPVAKHQEICRLNFSRLEEGNVTLIPFGVGEERIDAAPIEVSEYAPGYRAGSSDVPVPMRRIDDLVIDRAIDRVDFLKMDIEGSEMAALRGAQASIRKFRPKLALSIYHRPDDFFEIINWVHDLDLGYRLFVDHHTIYDEETVLYAWVSA